MSLSVSLSLSLCLCISLCLSVSLLPGVDAPRVYVCAWTLCCCHSLISTQTFQRALAASVDSCEEIKSAPSVRNQFWQSLEVGAGKRCLECAFEAYIKLFNTLLFPVSRPSSLLI